MAEVLARFRYDAMNRRVARQDAGGEWIYFAFDAGDRHGPAARRHDM